MLRSVNWCRELSARISKFSRDLEMLRRANAHKQDAKRPAEGAIDGGVFLFAAFPTRASFHPQRVYGFDGGCASSRQQSRDQRRKRHYDGGEDGAGRIESGDAEQQRL